MLYPISQQVPFLFQFTNGGTGKTGLTVYVSIVRVNTDGSRTTVITLASNTAATEVDATNQPGLYSYLLASGSTGTAGYYVATAHTAGTADLKDVAALEIVGPAWVATAAAAASSAEVATRSSHSAADVQALVAAGAVASVTGNIGGNVTGSVASVVGAVGSVTGNVGGNVTGSVGSIATGGITAGSIATDAIGSDELAASAVTKIAAGITIPSAAAIAAAVWQYLKATAGALDSTMIGRWLYDQLGLIGSARVTVDSPVAADQTVTIYTADDYGTATRRITWTVTGAPDFTNGTAQITTSASATIYAGVWVTTGSGIDQVLAWDAISTVTDDFTARADGTGIARYKATGITSAGKRITVAEGPLVIKSVP